MTLDVRMPIGLFFVLVGALLTVYGAVTRHEPGASPTGVPIDLVGAPGATRQTSLISASRMAVPPNRTAIRLYGHTATACPADSRRR